MDSSLGSETPVILQLHKWGPSHVQFDLSEFREAFISPTRELLLLLSYQCEALLLPLVSGCNADGRLSDGSHEDKYSCSLQSEVEPSRSDLKDDIPCTSASVMDFDNGFPLEHEFSRSNNYPFVSDVNSLAWGLCGDDYNQHKDALFKELLFVSGSHGVTVHAFCQPDKADAMTKFVLEGKFERGKWVDWGPYESVKLHNSFSLCSQDTSSIVAANGEHGNGERALDSLGETGVSELPRGFPSKRWFRSFLTKAETIESNGNTCTKFPDKSSFPSSAKVVSFAIFDGNFPFTDFLCSGDSFTNKKENSESFLITNNADDFSDSSGFGSYKCARVFSSNSHYLIGFVLSLVGPVSASLVDEKIRGNNTRNVIPVAKLHSWGIQWVSSVKIGGSIDVGPVGEWTDFCFSDDLLVCLNSSGLLYFYGAMSGEFLFCVDVIQSCGLNPQSGVEQQQKAPLVADVQIKQVADVHNNSSSQHHDISGRRMFRKLLVASHTSCVAVVDEYGVIYVIFADDYLGDDFYAYEKLLPHFRHLGLGMLVGWKVGGCGVGHQRLYSNNSSLMDRKVSFFDYAVNNTHQIINQWNLHEAGDEHDLFLSGFSAAPKMGAPGVCNSQVHSPPMRRVFLPTERFNDDDCVCFSPLGITRLIKKRNNEDHRSARIVHFNLHTDSAGHDDRCLSSRGKTLFVQGKEDTLAGEVVGCSFQGCFYLVTQVGLSVVLPAVSVSSNFLPVEMIGYRRHGIDKEIHSERYIELKELKEPFSPWKVEVLDRVLLYEGPEAADLLCLENGWELKVSRLRQLQMVLAYLKFDEIEQSLEMLVGVDQAEEGILRLLFAAVYLMSHKNSNDIEVSAASRLLTLATRFTTKMIRRYGLRLQESGAYVLQGFRSTRLLSLPPALPNKVQNEMGDSKRLHHMAHFLEIIRNLRLRLGEKLKKPSQGSDGGEESSLVAANLSQDETQVSILPANNLSLETPKQELSISASSINNEKLVLMPTLDIEQSNGVSSLVPQLGNLGMNVLPLENPKEMIERWKLDNLDLKTVVKDALLSGRLPLAVLQLHLHRSRNLDADKEPSDTFSEVHDIGRAIAYDLFLKGDTGLAVATLQRLGEDIETCLKQLLVGTVSRSLRVQVAEEMRRFGYLGPYEWNILEKILLIERLYPSGSFWRTFFGQQRGLTGATSVTDSAEIKLSLLHSHLFGDFFIECGEVDGVVLGSWMTLSEKPPDSVDEEDSSHAGYWAGAAVWCSTWDQRTFDRIVLDQPLLMGVHVLWESQLEYYICHNDWEEVSKLIGLIPASVLSEGSLQISLDSIQNASAVGSSNDFSDYSNYICSIEELDAVCMDVPGVKILRLSVNMICSAWLRMLMEQKLAKKFIFLKDYWDGTADIVSLLARSGFLTSKFTKLPLEDSVGTSLDLTVADGGFHSDTVESLHKLLIHHIVQHNLPNLLSLYLDHHHLVSDNDSLGSLLEAAGDYQWAKWLLLSRIRGQEYDASFRNARSIMSRNFVPDSNLGVTEIEDLIRTVDDIAEGGSEMAALATLMYAPHPIQNCLSSGSVNRHASLSAQCTLESLQPALQRFPTLWRMLVGASFGQDTTSSLLVPKTNSDLSEYLNWRDNIFFSTTRDTSLLQMLPCWFPKTVRRLIQLYIQGPLGWQSLSVPSAGDSWLHRDIEFYVNADEHTEINAVSWEATIQKHVQQELYDSSLEEAGLGLEHHLHRGRALASFNHILGTRVQNLKLEGHAASSPLGQTNVQSDVQTLLAPLNQSEEALLSSVIPLAIMHFEDSVLVASCAFLLELCGLSASMLRVDIASLRRISSFYKSSSDNEKYNQFSPKGSAFHLVSHEGGIAESLARSLADEYLHKSCASSAKLKGTSGSSKQSSRVLIVVLHHLEKASLPQITEGNTCGSWLLTGIGDGAELRSQQKAASEHWTLVTVFCQMHQLPLSTKYLAVLARDNDWVGFLSEAHSGGYPFETVMDVASKEFGDPRLKIHILTILKGMQSRRKAASAAAPMDLDDKKAATSCSDENILIPVELFRILAECEKQKYPGEALLRKAKELSWSLLAMIASCFSDVSPLPCLTVWLEITAARETSSIKVNDIASQIADNVEAAVKATNSLSAGSRALIFHYNRQNPKRRRLVEPMSMDLSIGAANSSGYCRARGSSDQSVVTGEERRQEVREPINVSSDSDEGPETLSKMVAVLCEQQLFLPLLRAFELFLPSCALLPFIRALQAFSQMRLSEASAHLGSFSARLKDESLNFQLSVGREGQIGMSWISSTAVKAADAMLSTCPSPYEKRCLLQLLTATDFGDGGLAAIHYRRLLWKINLAEPLLRKDDSLHLGNETLDDASLLTALEKNGHWEQARNWARQLEASGGPWKSAVHHVTETQAESMVAEWKEFLWDVPEERVALWSHCQTLFIRYSFPALQAGLFFLKHAEAVEKDLPARELHELLLLSLQWLSGMITLSNPVYPLHLLREIETRVWLLAVESEAQVKSDGDSATTLSSRDPVSGNATNIIDRTANLISKMDNHINLTRNKAGEKHDAQDNNMAYQKNQVVDTSNIAVGSTRTKRRAKGYMPSRRPAADQMDKNTDSEDASSPLIFKNDLQLQDENLKIEMSFSKWEERVGHAELERAVLSLLEFGQITAAKQLKHKLSPEHTPPEFALVDAALKLGAVSTPGVKVSLSMLDEDVRTVIQSYGAPTKQNLVDPLQALQSLSTIFTEGSGRGLCKRIIAVVRAAKVLGLSFLEAFDKQPIELLQLLSLKAQESYDEASLLVQTHSMPAASIAQILAESFLKGLLAAHRGGYMDSQKEEGPAPLLWRFSDFLKWAELCPSEPEIGHALMRLVITGQEIPHACEVELLILSHHFYKASACLDGVDVLVALAATRVDAYVSEGDFACLARLITGVGNFHGLNFILGILIENGQLDLLLQKYSAAADANTGTADAVRGFRMAVLTSLKHFNPKDLDAFAMVYNHFDMKHETAALLESRALQSSEQWFRRYDKDHNEDLLESMRYFIEAAQVHSSIDAGNKTRRACAQASLVSLQIRMPDSKWLNLSETNARRLLVEQSQFQEALIVAEAYGLNQPSEWALVLWNQMLNPELTEEFVAEFVAVLPLQPSMLVELARFYRAEVAARGDQSQFSVWLTGGGLPAEWAKYLGRSFRCLLKRTRDLRIRLQLATVATGFIDIIVVCNKALDKVPDNAGPLVLRKGHGGAYLPLM